jgi:hypothetical protein
VLEEAAEELERLQIDVGPLAGGAVAVRPAQSTVGQEGEATVAGGGLEDVTAQVTQGGMAGADGLTVRNPALLPGLGGRESGSDRSGV